MVMFDHPVELGQFDDDPGTVRQVADSHRRAAAPRRHGRIRLCTDAQGRADLLGI